MSFKPCSTVEERPGRFLDATYQGRKYRIPEMWLAGFMQSNPGVTIPDVLRWWHEMQLLGEQEGSASIYALAIVALCVIPVIVFLGHLVAFLHSSTTTLAC